MFMRKLSAIVGAIATGLLAFPTISSAAPVLSKDSVGNMYITGLTPSTRAAVMYNSPKIRNIATNACGLLSIRSSAAYPIGTTLHVNGTAITVSSLPDQAIPKCTNGVLASTVTGNFRAPTGAVVITGLTALTQYPVTYDGTQITRNATVNACGFTRLTQNTKYPANVTLSVDGTTLDPSTVTASSPPLCRNGVKYNPGT